MRPIAPIAQDVKASLSDFLQTRYDIFANEMRHKRQKLQLGLPLALAGTIGAGVAFVLLTFALIALIAVPVPQGLWAWFWAALFVGLFFALAAVLFAWLGIREVQHEGAVPKETMRVLKEDRHELFAADEADVEEEPPARAA